jgi:hypothetical protein
MGRFSGNLVALMGFLSIATWKQVGDMNSVLSDFVVDDENIKATQPVSDSRSHHYLRANNSPPVVVNRPEDGNTLEG